MHGWIDLTRNAGEGFLRPGLIVRKVLAVLRVAGVAWDDVGLPARAIAMRKRLSSPWP